LLHHILDEKSLNPMLTNDLYGGLGLFLDYKIFGYSPMFEQEFARYVRTGKEDVKQNRNLWESAEYLFLKPEKSVLDSPDMQFCLTKLGLTKPALDNINERVVWVPFFSSSINIEIIQSVIVVTQKTPNSITN